MKIVYSTLVAINLDKPDNILIFRLSQQLRGGQTRPLIFHSYISELT